MASYLLFVTLGIALTLLVGQLAYRSGKVYLADLFADRAVADSVSRLLAVLFHLVVLGVLGIISTIEVPVEGAAQTVVTKLGVVLLILGLAHGAVLAVLARLRTRRAEQALLRSWPPARHPVTAEPVAR